MQIDGKVALITGASEGIGAACAAEFRRRGAKLSLTARSEDKLEAVAAGDAVITAGDLTDPEVRRKAVDNTLERYGRIDILVNNAGVGLYASAWRAPMETVRHMFELNFFAALDLIQLVVPQMRERRSGAIVNVSSVAGQVTLPWLTLYSASKFAIRSLSDGLRLELKRDNIQVTTVCPGYVKTGFGRHVLGGEVPDGLARYKTSAITAEECAAALVRGVERNARTVVAPRIAWVLVAADHLLPSVVDARLAAIYHSVKQA